MSERSKRVNAGKRLLQSLKKFGVDYIFANFGTDHTPLLEAAARLRSNNSEFKPEFITCPHEFAAMSAAHGYAAITGNPQATLVHVDVGTQNLGAAMHNAHRAHAPIFVISGLAPVTDAGHSGSRDHPVHYAQDTFDQSGIVREYCRWVDEYKPPSDPAVTVSRGLERATSECPGPVYVSATREALETTIDTKSTVSSPRGVNPSGASADTVAELTNLISEAENPLVITGNIPTSGVDDPVETLVDFAESSGAGVIEHSPACLCFPRTHPLHAGYNPHDAFKHADLIIIAGTDVPWIPSEGTPPSTVPVVQIDADPTKPRYPHWSFRIDYTVSASPVETLAAVADTLSGEVDYKETVWAAAHSARHEDLETTVDLHRENGQLTPAVVSDTLNEVVNEEAVLVEGAVTSRDSLLNYLELDRPGSYIARGGAGLGWAPGAAVGVKLANPDARVIAAVGDGSYMFGNPIASAWMGVEANAPTITIVYNNQGWGAVEAATEAQHPTGESVAAGVPESDFSTPIDLSAPATAVGAYTERVQNEDELKQSLQHAVDAVKNGNPAVIDVVLD